MFARMDLNPSGYFVAAPHLVGSTDQEIIDVQIGRLPPERVKAVADALEVAARKFIATEAIGNC